MAPNETSFGSQRQEIMDVGGDPEGSSGKMRLMDFIPIYIPAVEKGAISRSKKTRFLDFLRARPSKDWFLQSTFVGRIRRRRQATADGEDPDAADESDGGPRPRRRFRVPFVRQIKWGKLWSYAVSWCSKPANFAMIIWLDFVAAGLLLLLLLMTGLLDEAIPDENRRKKWTEVVNQIINALFTIMCLYQHPPLFHHLVLLLRWRPDGDREEIRKVYCKDGAPRPHDRAHMLTVVVLFHITCLAQYFCCALYWAYTRTDRPDWALNTGIGVGTAFPVIAALYLAYSPLGRKLAGEPESDPSASDRPAARDVELEIYHRLVVVSSPEWSGGLCDCCDDGTVCALSAACTFCVFGWNMERLGFGNMYVHTFTFILLCAAPIIIFSVTALNIHDGDIFVVGAGVLLGFCGFLYGGFWRMQMRNRYKLPSRGGRGWAAAADCAKWLFCWSCALAQEVRTANFYDVEGEQFVVSNEDGHTVLVPLPRDGHVRSQSCPPEIDAFAALKGGGMSPVEVDIAMERSITYSGNDRHHAMSPPLPSLIQTDQN